LLLVRSSDYYDTALVTVDLATGQLRRQVPIHEPHDSPTSISWSPNGRLLTLTTEARSQADYAFALIDIATGRIRLQCKGPNRCPWLGANVWSPEGDALFKTSTSGRTIMQVDLSGRQTTVITEPSGRATPLLVDGRRLLYQRDTYTSDRTLRSTLYIVDTQTHRRRQLVSFRPSITAVLPLRRLP
jgi:Tol biopolymer transport system component